MNILVGNSGFVGSNLSNHKYFDLLCNSKNISDAFNKNPDLLVYAGVKAQKFIANENPEKDFEHIAQAIDNIKRINPDRIVLISTIDVCGEGCSNEKQPIQPEKLHAYGKNRYFLEQWVADNIKNHTVIRLPALFGKNLKKNFIFDLMNRTPQFLNQKTYDSLKEKAGEIENFYKLHESGFYKLVSEYTKEAGRVLSGLNFSSLKFTDSRASFPFYNLEYLFNHMLIAIDNSLHLVHMAVEPLTAGEIYQYIYGEDFNNEIGQSYPKYNFTTIYSKFFGGNDGYIFSKAQILEEIKRFVVEERI